MIKGLEQGSCRPLLPESLHSSGNLNKQILPFVARDHSVTEFPSGPEEGILLAHRVKVLEILPEVSTTPQRQPILGVSIVSIILPLKSFCTSFQVFKNKTPA